MITIIDVAGIANDTIENNVYYHILNHRTPVGRKPKVKAKYALSDLLDDYTFRMWLHSTVADGRVRVTCADMLLIPALRSLAYEWLNQTEDYKQCMITYPDSINELATIGIAVSLKQEDLLNSSGSKESN